MKITICKHVQQLGQVAAEEAAKLIREAIARRGAAGVLFAAGASQFEIITSLIIAPDIDWAKVTGYQLDEFIGLPATHTASHARFLRERLAGRVKMGALHTISGDAPDPAEEARRIGMLLKGEIIDVALLGIGDNAGIAFNDPPADFTAFKPYIVTELGEKSRSQQVREKWFDAVDDVPEEAITMSPAHLLKADAILCAAAGAAKAAAVQAIVEGPVTPDVPASILQRHQNCRLYIDRDSAARLKAAQVPPGVKKS